MVRFGLMICVAVCALGWMSDSCPAGAPSDAAKKPADSVKPEPIGVAQIEIKGSYPEGAQLPGLFSELTENLSDSLARLDKAAGDEKISTVLLKLENPAIGWAKIHEFRTAIARVRAKGKRVIATADSASTPDYLLAAACDEIVMPESGMLMLLGLRAEVSFYKNLFDKLDVKAEMLRVGEYKSAAEPYTRTEMSPEFRKEMEAILDDYLKQIVEAIAKGRNLDKDEVMAAIDSGPHTAKSAKELGLIDRVAYEDEIPSILKAGTEREVKLTRRYGRKKLDTDFSGFGGMMKMMNMMMGIEEPKRRTLTPKIAVIHATGAITEGKSAADFLGGETLGSETFVKAVKTAADDATVKAIVVRVDSPGGSALASDLMWRALEKVEKPIVVSMGDVAASGGYYISMGADRIFAEPGTLTGSIGVVGGKIALKGLYDKVGITTTVLSRGKNSGVMSTTDGFTDSEREAMQKMLYDVYEQFTKKAAQGRKMEHEKLEKLARGRVYTGSMALEIGLVDELGTLDDAVAHARKLAGLKEDDKVDRMILPKPVSPLEQLFGPLDPDAQSRMKESSAVMQAMRTFAPELVEHLQGALVVQTLAREGRMLLMPFRVRVK